MCGKPTKAESLEQFQIRHSHEEFPPAGKRFPIPFLHVKRVSRLVLPLVSSLEFLWPLTTGHRKVWSQSQTATPHRAILELIPPMPRWQSAGDICAPDEQEHQLAFQIEQIDSDTRKD